MRSVINLKPLNAIGAEVVAQDPESIDKPEIRKALYTAWLEYGVLLFRTYGDSVERHIQVSKVFGPLEEHPIKSILVKGNNDLIQLGGEGDNKGRAVVVQGEVRAGYLYFHQDTAYTPDICKGSVLRMIQMPQTGGDTVWADTEKAYAELPQKLKKKIAGLSTVQCYRDLTDRTWGQPELSVRAARPEEGPDSVLEIPDFPLVIHPMVIAHPESGKKSLMLSPMGFVRIDGMDEMEGNELFEEIMAHTLQDRYLYHHQWQVNDVIVWDNRRTLHSALGYPFEQIRTVYRTTLKGAMPTGRYYHQEGQNTGTANTVPGS